MMPPIELMKTISKPAMASPRTNLLAPSMAPKKALSSSSALRRSRACCSLMRPEERSASIAICLPGMASKVKRAATSAIRVEPRVMTTKFTITRIANTMSADDEIAAHHELREGVDHFAGGVFAGVAVARASAAWRRC